MKQILTLTIKRTILILICSVAVAWSVFHFVTAEAVTVQTVGTISALLAPNSGGGLGTEFVELAYAGPGAGDLSGWSLSNSSGTIMMLDGVLLTDKLRICEKDGQDPNCRLFWSGNDVFKDEGDSLYVLDTLGNIVINISYLNSELTTTVSSSGDFVAEV